MTQTRLFLVGAASALLMLLGPGCGDDDRRVVDSGPGDASTGDGGEMDAGTDAGGGMDAGMDAGTDAGMDGGSDAGAGDAGTDAGTDAGDPGAEDIAAVRETADGTGLSLSVSGVYVTYIKEVVGSDPAGFFVQATMTGPALFVAVDPSTLSEVPNIGHEVGFTVTDLETVDGLQRVTGISGWGVITTGNDISGLIQDITSATDVVSDLDSYESELISVEATIASGFGFAGTGHVAADIETAGVSGSADYELRVAQEVQDMLALHDGCTVTVTATPMWRFAARAQVSVYDVAEVTSGSCDAPQVVSASPTSATQVVVTFDRILDPTSIMSDGSQFTFDMGLTASAATVDGSEVTVTTSAQTAATDYTVTVATTVTDVFGTTLDSSANTASFVGYIDAVAPSAAGELVITEIMQNPAATADGDGEYFELYNPSGTVTYNIRDCIISDDGSDSHTISTNVYLFPGDYVTLAVSASPGFTPDYVYSGYTLANGDDEVVLTCGGTEIDRVNYDGGTAFPDPTGASMNLDSASLDATSNDTGANWCESTTDLGNTDLGTPGAANESCP